MTAEEKWIKSFVEILNKDIKSISPSLQACAGYKLPYAFEIIDYIAAESNSKNTLKYQTDILILENLSKGWKPRIVIEGKLATITTHDAITYSNKARSHKNVQPYLRYGILLGERKEFPLPGRLYRHGENFDFMISWKKRIPSDTEWNLFLKLIKQEFFASKSLEEIILNSKKHNRKFYILLHKQLKLK